MLFYRTKMLKICRTTSRTNKKNENMINNLLKYCEIKVVRFSSVNKSLVYK